MVHVKVVSRGEISRRYGDETACTVVDIQQTSYYPPPWPNILLNSSGNLQTTGGDGTTGVNNDSKPRADELKSAGTENDPIMIDRKKCN